MPTPVRKKTPPPAKKKPAAKAAPAKAKPARKPPARPAPKAARPAPKPARPAPVKKAAVKPPEKKPAAPVKAASPAPAKPAPVPAKAPPAKAAVPPAVKPGAAPPAKGAEGRPAAPEGRVKPKKSGRRGSMPRRGADGELITPGELLLAGGPQNGDEVLYLLRGCVAAEHPNGAGGVEEVVAKRKLETEAEKEDLRRLADTVAQRFEAGIEPMLPPRTPSRRTFQGVVERAKHRRREIGAFLRGLDLGRTESSHMDSHGEASMQSLMEWAARLEVLAEKDEPENADFGQFLRVLDQLDSTTESLIVDVEQTLRRLRDRLRSAGKL